MKRGKERERVGVGDDEERERRRARRCLRAIFFFSFFSFSAGRVRPRLSYQLELFSPAEREATDVRASNSKKL